MMHLPYFGQGPESKRKVVEILAHVWSQHNVQLGEYRRGTGGGGKAAEFAECLILKWTEKRNALCLGTSDTKVKRAEGE